MCYYFTSLYLIQLAHFQRLTLIDTVQDIQSPSDIVDTDSVVENDSNCDAVRDEA
jgi:hypothetical protein